MKTALWLVPLLIIVLATSGVVQMTYALTQRKQIFSVQCGYRSELAIDLQTNGTDFKYTELGWMETKVVTGKTCLIKKVM